MPAPLARGILLSLSLLIAAGIAVYEHPQIRQWIDENRRKLALALHGLGDEVHPGSLFSQNDVSLREDNSPEAVERRRIARQAILERARLSHESRWGSEPGQRKRGTSFDDLVDDEGKLRDKQTEGVTMTGTDRNESSAAQQLRNRSVEASGMARGTAAANPFADEMVMSYNSGLSEEEALERATRESRTNSLALDTDLAAALAASVAEMEYIRGEQASANTNAGADDAARSETSESEVLLDLTPTTSRAPSSFHPLATPGSAGTLSAGRSPAQTPRSTASATFDTLPEETAIPPIAMEQSVSAMSNFQSIHEWAASSTVSVYSPPQSETGIAAEAPILPAEQHPPEILETLEPLDAELISRPQSRALEEMEVSEPGSDHGDALSEAEVMSVSDFRSNNGGASTPGAWTDVGSVVSEGH